MSLPSPVDQAVRDRIARALDDTLFVEAGAGTGKTTALVSRIVALVRSGLTTIDRIAAITFTEAAASELREKVRLDLEEEAKCPSLEQGARELCSRAVGNLESSFIQTLHSFAGALLRERPLDAGLPPTFDIVEEIEADISFEDRWRLWLDEALDSPDLAPHFLRCLSLGLRLEDLRKTAKAFHENYDLLAEPFPLQQEPESRAAEAVAGAAPELRRLLPLARNGVEDPLASHAARVAALGDRLATLGLGAGAPVATLARWGKLSSTSSKQAAWDTDPVTGANGCKAIKDRLKELEELRSLELQAVRRAAILPLLEGLRWFTLGYAAERKDLGRAEFHDLLVWARNLVRDNLEARAYFQQRFSHILIDEFQDTDPIQAEIAFFLSGSPDDAGAPDEAAKDWTKIKVAPGKLFVVGDPKQSIYRFRRADIAAVEKVRNLLGTGAVVDLVQNFRSQDTVIAWCNALFGQWMEDDGSGLQAKYIPLSASWTPPESFPPLGVHWLGGPYKGPAGLVRQIEADAIASLLLQIKSLPWAVRAEDQGNPRGANFQDVCILLPARTGLRSLERALDEANVPYRVEGQSLVLGTQDVRELLDCLRAIDAPADQIALVAALRSSAFGCSDLELLEFIEQGGRLDYVNPSDASGPVREALSALLRYHLERTWTPPDELIEKFVREQAMVEVSFARARPRERWRRLRFVIERARAFTQVKGNSLRSFLDWIERQAKEGARLVETPAPETDEDAVRIMTIHAAKGLEFPIVVLAGLGSAANFWSNTLLLDQKREKVEVRIGAKEAGFSTGGYEEAKDQEKEAEQAEDVRLMYVAATRARDHLVVSLFRSERATSSHASSISQMAAAAPDLWNQIALTGAAASKALDAVPTVGVIDTGEDRERWQKDRTALIERASMPASLAVTALAGTEKDEAEGGEVPYRRGRGGASLGRAVHAVLQSVDLETGEGLEAIARAQAMAEGIPDRWAEIVELASRALSSAVVKRAVNSGRYYREVFVSTPLNGTLLEGFIDLVFEEDGALVIADYKTDLLDEEIALERAQERYSLQVSAYAFAVQQATSMPVREVVLVFLRPAREVSFTNIAELTDEARKLAEAKTAGSITE